MLIDCSHSSFRKGAMLLNSAIAVVATVIMYISKPAYSFELILVARFLIGFGAGMSDCIINDI